MEYYIQGERKQEHAIGNFGFCLDQDCKQSVTYVIEGLEKVH